jgi:tetratricopeptide (TPR) repeat protein
MLISQIYMDLRNVQKAEEYLNKASAKVPGHTDLFVLRAKILAAGGDTSSALGNLFAALQKDQHNTGSYKELVRIYESSRKPDSALVFLTIGRSISPRDPFFFYYDGRFFESLNFKQAAKKSYETALKADSTYYPAYYSLALMAYKQEDYTSALKNFVYVVRFDPTQKEANLYAAELYERNNQGYEAISYYERVRAVDTSNVKAKSALEKLYIQYPERKKVSDKDTMQVIKADTSQAIKQDSVIKPIEPGKPKSQGPANKPPLSIKPANRDTGGKGSTTNTKSVEEGKKDTVK